MAFEFIAMIVIMLVMIALALLLLKTLSSSADARIRSDMMKLLKSYDHIIDDKTREVRQLERQKQKILNSMPGGLLKSNDEAVAKPGSRKKTAEKGGNSTAREDGVMRTAVYRTENLKAGYLSIKDSFEQSRQSMENLMAMHEDFADRLNTDRAETAEKFLKKLDFNTLFDLSMMEPAKQLWLLRQGCEKEEQELLDSYLESRSEKRFSAADFKTWLEDRIALEGKQVSVRFGNPDIEETENMQYCDDIVEGIQVRVGGRLYDYSIKEREIG